MDQKRSFGWMACIIVCAILAGCGAKQYALPQAAEPADRVHDLEMV